MKQIILGAIRYANAKSSRSILNIPDGAMTAEINQIYKREGKRLFAYFIKYYGDPAATAHQCLGQHYADVAQEQFRNRTLQKERMNSGWRYQYMAKEAATKSGRFVAVSDIGSAEADFNAKIQRKDVKRNLLNIYVSVKNRSNTMGGQDWPKAIQFLEDVANTDKNREGPYICVFGIAMERGLGRIKNKQKTKTPYSVNTEVWLSDYFWPFFTNYSYDAIVKVVLEALMEATAPDSLQVDVPQEVLLAFGEQCRKHDLLDAEGKFNDAYKLVDLFCGTQK